MVLYVISTGKGYFAGLHRRLPFFRLKPEFHWDLTLKSGPLKVYRSKEEAWAFIATNRPLFPAAVTVKAHNFTFIAGS